MLISIFTPTNDGTYLEEVWRSLRAQTHKEFEWVIVPNGELKNLPKILTSDVRIKIFPTADIFDNVGALKRFACEHCRGDLLVELDHDDLLVPRCLERLAATADPDKAQFLYSDFATVNTKLEPITYDKKWGWETYNLTFNGNLVKASRAFAICPTALSCLQFAPNHVRAWTRKAYDQAGGHSAEYQIADDYDLLLRTYLAGIEFIQIPECLYIYRIHEDNTSNKRNDKIQEAQQQIFNDRCGAVVAEWTRREGLKAIELAISTGQESPFETVHPLRGVTATDGDRPYLFPGLSDLASDSVGQLVCRGLLPFLSRSLIIPFFEECHRVLAPGGWLRLQFPSANFASGFQNPMYNSYWNTATLRTFTNKQCAEMAGGHRARFHYLRAWDTWDNQDDLNARLIKSCADLVAVKDKKQPGAIEI